MKTRALVSSAPLALLASSFSLLALHCGGSAVASSPTQSAPIAPPPDMGETPTPAPPPPALVGSPSQAAKPAGPVKWTYAGAEDGAAKWGDLSPDFATCKAGKQQSPIDIAKTTPKGKGLSPIVFSYSPIPIQIVNTGFTVVANNTTPSSMSVGTDKYALVQWHLHSPSEHTLDGKHFDAELHLVHKNDKGETAVVAILLKKGKEAKAVKALLDNAPAEASKEPKTAQGTIDLAPFAPSKAAYVTYPGSLTVPPCTEGVRWLVLQKPMEIGEAQIKKLEELTHGATSRPVQPLEGRAPAAFAP